jgi:hypothetical protein
MLLKQDKAKEFYQSVVINNFLVKNLVEEAKATS